jgi:hypothetical protein
VNAVVPRRQRWPLYVGAVIVALIVLLSLLRHFMQPDRLSATLLEEAGKATGLSLKLATPADISLWPDLNVVMRGLEARSEAGARPILVAERVELALPWSTLWGGEIEVSALRLHRPRLDRDALAAWLQSRPAAVGPANPPRLPRLKAELAVTEGRVVGRGRASWELGDIELRLSRLLPGEDFRLALGLDYLEGEQRLPLRLDATGFLHAEGMPLELAPLALRWLDSEQEELLRLNGQLELAWPHRLQFLLEGRGSHWPTTWPAPPAAADELNAEYALMIEFLGTPDLRGPLKGDFSRGRLAGQFEAETGELLAWLMQPGTRSLPPVRATAQTPLIEREGLRIEGLHIELREEGTGADAR